MKSFITTLRLTILKAIIVRVTFVVHVLVTVYRVVEAYTDPLFWLLLISLCGLLFETTITLTKRSGKEWTWFSPAIFFYLIAAVPPIWLLELQLSQLRAQPNNQSVNVNTSEVQFIQTIGIEIPLDLAGWALAMEQALLFILILGRWFMPKGNISKNQLSQILLVYIGMAADIMELFEVFKEEEVAFSLSLTYPTLTLWSVALFQYTLAIGTTKPQKSRFQDEGDTEEEEVIEEEIDFDARKCGLDDVNIDVLGIMTTIIMQDGPFLCFRLYLMAGIGVISQMMVFFTCKNLLVIILQIYRLFVIYCEAKKEENDNLSFEIGSSQNLHRFPIKNQKDTTSLVSSNSVTGNKNELSKENSQSNNLNGGRQINGNLANGSNPRLKNDSTVTVNNESSLPRPKEVNTTKNSNMPFTKPTNQQSGFKMTNNRVSPSPPEDNSLPVTRQSWNSLSTSSNHLTNFNHPNEVRKI